MTEVDDRPLVNWTRGYGWNGVYYTHGPWIVLAPRRDLMSPWRAYNRLTQAYLLTKRGGPKRYTCASAAMRAVNRQIKKANGAVNGTIS